MPKINDPKELQEWVDNTETILADMKVKAEQAEKLEEENKTLKEEVTNLQKQVSDLGNLIVINKNAWHETDPKRKADYDFGKWLGAVQRRDYRTLISLDTRISITERGKDAKIIPLSEATKSMLRNVSAEGQKGEVGNLLGEGFKADLGTPLDTMGAHTSNGEVNCWLIRGKLSPMDMPIPSKAKAMCRDFTPAIL